MESNAYRERRRRPRPRRPGVALTQQQLDERLRNRQPLSGTNLEELSLAGLDLTGHSLAGARLVRADLRGARLADASFADADLREANLEGADLAGCDFAGADLHGVRLVGSALCGADLTRTFGLTQDQLRATRLPGAKLPASLFEFDGLERVRELVNRAERTLYVLLLACASVAVICGTTSDQQLFQSNSALTLPGLDLAVPCTSFYRLAPLLLLGFYLSLSFTLRKLWLELANLPAQFPNDRWLYRQAAPSTPSFAAATAPYVRGETSHLVERMILTVAVWLVTPATLLYMLWSYVPRHDPGMTTWHYWVFVAMALSGVWFHWNMHFILSRSFGPAGVRKPLALRRTREAAAAYAAAFAGRWRGARMGRMRGGVQAHSASPGAPTGWLARRRAQARATLLERSGRFALREAGFAAAIAVAVALPDRIQWAMDSAGCRDPLTRASEAPTGCNRAAAQLGGASLAGLQLPGGNLRRGFLHSTQLADADLERADLSFANLVNANLRGASLKDAALNGAALWQATLDGTRLKEAYFQRADLRGASLRFAQAQGANFSGADLRGVDWTGALVCGALFHGAQVDTAALRQARGWQLTLGAGLESAPVPLAPGEGVEAPAYLHGGERREYARWQRAWRAVRGDPEGAVAGRSVDYESVRAFIDTIDVSMGESRQRQKLDLLALLGQSRNDKNMVVYGGRLYAAIHAFRGKIETKAINHCVDVDAPASGRATPASPSRPRG